MPPIIHELLFPDAFLVSSWASEYRLFRGSVEEAALIRRLRDWAAKRPQKEKTAEAAFVGVFFKDTWGYRAAGEGPEGLGHTREPQFPIKGAGQGGGTGFADLALGHFDHANVAATPQVLCEFKGVSAGLDRPQNRKGNDRSPVKQCADYIKAANGALFGNEPIQTTWGIVSDMNEFRLYWRNKIPAQYQRFVIVPAAGDTATSLLADSNAAAFQRFVFWRMFQADMLLSTGGASPLERLLTEQWVQARAIENDFYKEYHAYRQTVFNALVEANPDFGGTQGKLVRLTQRFLDRSIFVLFCEDMGAALGFPPNILRDVLAGTSKDPDYDPNDDAAWSRVKKLFASMRDGSPFRGRAINRFNGGLFAPEPELESLHVPTRLFCAANQGAGADALISHKETLLYFSARYNFGVTDGAMERSIGLYTLGRIFEQSITDLEFMEAKADGRVSITELAKRKRDGVYYTPEWITAYLVEETVGARLRDIRRQFALDPMPVLSDDEISRYQQARAPGKSTRRRERPDQRFKTENVERYMVSLDAYGQELDALKVVDPACGSGAFLIQVLKRLISERRWLTAERERITGRVLLFDIDVATKSVLSQNIYGVDINEESVEITRLALWLHTALPDRPLSSLDDNIRCGNSLVDRRFYKFKQEGLFTVDERERINAFDWKKAFPAVFGRAGGKSGFDCVVGNPPYVKLQHFLRAMPDVAEFLSSAKKTASAGSEPLYSSTQTRNFDLYLPFIERSVELLNEDGRMGFIAPSVWLISEYGEGLRRFVKKSRRLERWVDFRDYPVFEEAMTYTALQFYRGGPSDGVKCVFAPDGELGAVEWDQPDALIPYEMLPEDDVWILLPERERALVDRLNASCARLDESAEGIIVGIQTSADHIFHLERLGPGRYRQFPKKARPIDVEIEDGLMRPLVSGDESKRYCAPYTTFFLLFPYADDGGGERLLTTAELERRFPRGWRYLRAHEQELRDREKGAFDDEKWYRFGRHQNIDRQKLPKLGVAQTAPELRVFFDRDGAYCFNNVRVNAILARDPDSAYFLMGLLNGRVCDFVFRRRAKPKEPRPSGAYFEANKQYIAPLPVPRASQADRARLAELARELEREHTARRDTVRAIDRRLDSEQMVPSPRPAQWLWADVRDISYWAARNSELKGRALTAWARRAHEEKLAGHLAAINEAMTFGATMCANLVEGELRFYVRDQCVISGLFVGDDEGPVILAQWRRAARDTFVSDTVDAARVVGWLLDLRSTDNPALVAQIRGLNQELEAIEDRIRSLERALDDLSYSMYALTDDERHMVEGDTQTRWNARMPTSPR